MFASKKHCLYNGEGQGVKILVCFYVMIMAYPKNVYFANICTCMNTIKVQLLRVPILNCVLYMSLAGQEKMGFKRYKFEWDGHLNVVKQQVMYDLYALCYE